MNKREADATIALLRHLDGSRIYDETDLLTDVQLLRAAAGVALGCPLPLDEDAVLVTLTETAQRHADGEGL
jgi:hypothetical protein